MFWLKVALSMFTVDDVLNKHYPQVANKPWLFKSLSFVLRHLLHEREIREFGEDFPHLQGIEFIEQVLEYFNFSYSTRGLRERTHTESRPSGDYRQSPNWLTRRYGID